MSEIDMSQPVADVKEENKLLSRRKRFLALMKTRKFWKELIGKVFIYTMLIDFALVFIIPILYMIVTGIESPVDLADEDVVWIPKRPLYTENMKWSTLNCFGKYKTKYDCQYAINIYRALFN